MKKAKGVLTTILGKIVRFGPPVDADPSARTTKPCVREFPNEDGTIGRILYFDIRELGTDDKVKIHARSEELFEVIMEGTKYDYVKEQEITLAKPELGSRVKLRGYIKDIPDYVHDDGKRDKQRQMNIASDSSFAVIIRKRKKAKRKTAPATAL